VRSSLCVPGRHLLSLCARVLHVERQEVSSSKDADLDAVLLKQGAARLQWASQRGCTTHVKEGREAHPC